MPLDDLSGSIAALADAADRPDWSCLEEIDVPQRQGPLSHAVDEAAFNRLLNTSPSCSHFRTLALSSLPHAGDWLNVIPSPALGLHLQDGEFRLCLATVSTSGCLRRVPSARSARGLLTLMVTTTWVVVAMETGSFDTTLSAMQSSQ